MKYTELHQIFSDACHQHRRDKEFVGFRWINCKKVHDTIKDRLISAKRSGLLERDGKDYVVDMGVADAVMRSTRESIEKKSSRMAEKHGDDNGWGENCLLFLQRVEDEVRREIEKRVNP